MRSSCWYAVAVGLALGGLIGAIWAVLLLVGVAAGVALAFAVTPWAHQQICGDPLRTARLDSKERRVHRLEAASVPTTQIEDVTALVDKVAYTFGEPVVAQHRLLEVLDAYAELVVARSAYERVLHGTNREALVKDLATLTRRDDEPSVLRRRCLQHRLEHWDACRAGAERCNADMAALSEYLFLVGERAITADVVMPTHDLDQRLDDVERHNLAMIELTGT